MVSILRRPSTVSWSVKARILLTVSTWSSETRIMRRMMRGPRVTELRSAIGRRAVGGVLRLRMAVGGLTVVVTAVKGRSREVTSAVMSSVTVRRLIAVRGLLLTVGRLLMTVRRLLLAVRRLRLTVCV